MFSFPYGCSSSICAAGYLLRLNGSGTQTWMNQFIPGITTWCGGGAHNLAADSLGDGYLSGYFNVQDTGEFKEVFFTGVDNYYLMKLGPAGSVQWFFFVNNPLTSLAINAVQQFVVGAGVKTHSTSLYLEDYGFAGNPVWSVTTSVTYWPGLLERVGRSCACRWGHLQWRGSTGTDKQGQQGLLAHDQVRLDVPNAWERERERGTFIVNMMASHPYWQVQVQVASGRRGLEVVASLNLPNGRLSFHFASQVSSCNGSRI